jgi:ABC-type Fe3+/spermidine/putrescine transport system ATPase subunit
MEVKSYINIEKCSVRFNKQNVLSDISLSIEQGNFVSILGPSGSGKTTLVRLVAGLEIPHSGEIFIAGKLVSGSGKLFVQPSSRKTGFIFQDLALWPHFTVHENVSFGLKANGILNVDAEVLTTLNQFGIQDLQFRYPHELSGGQQQLVALARSIILKPSILIMDEPLTNLDVKNKRTIRRMVKQLQQNGLTIIYITHDHREAFELSDKILVINNGQMEAFDSPEKITNGDNAFIKEFLEID